MYKIGTVNTTDDSWTFKNVFRDSQLNFSTIEIELQYEKGPFAHYIHFDYILADDADINQLITDYLQDKLIQ